MDVRELVQGHYGAGDLSEAILAALADAGTDLTRLTPQDLYPVDQLHAGGAAATQHVLERLNASEGQQLLDVGCGIGGPSRMAASRGADVTGVDLTDEFVTTSTELTARVGLSRRARFVVSPGEALPFEDASFDGALMVHVGMNMPDKQVVFTEVHRVLRPGSAFAVFEQVRAGEGDLTYPLPWAVDERSSFVESAASYSAYLEGAGFTVDEVEDRTTSTLGPPPAGSLSPMAVFGPAFGQRVGNNIAATRAGLLAAVLIVARA